MNGCRDIDDLVDRLGRALQGRSDVHLAILFGSRARGAAGRESDVDLAVEASDVDPLALARELGEVLGLEVDVVRLQDVGYPLLKALVRDGRVVHQGVRGAAGSWRARAIASLETDRPWFERMRDAWLQRMAKGAS